MADVLVCDVVIVTWNTQHPKVVIVVIVSISIIIIIIIILLLLQKVMI